MDTHARPLSSSPALAPNAPTPTAQSPTSPRPTGPFGPFPFERFRRLRFGPGRPSCLHCDGARVHRWGSFSGRRRYRCVTCGRTFSDFTGTPLAHLKRIDRWPAYCYCILDTLTVRRTARRLGIDKDTAFRWRHRLLAGLEASDTAPLGPTVALGETWFPQSAKGSRRLDRPARRRAAFRRIDMTPVWVIVARASDGRPASRVIGRQRPRGAQLVAALGDRLGGAVDLVSTEGPYGAPAMLAIHLRITHRRLLPSSVEITAVRSYILALRRWLRRFRGVATRYLANYLAWHRFTTLTDPVRSDSAARLLLATRFP